MPNDIIHLLSDHLANQIAAGEVIQRPASAVKELMENAVDAGATDIRLVIKDAGKELIQVTDNGKGMSPTDARMSFERHATSKIQSIEDLFQIRTMGFRGEALASVAAVSQVELKTRTHDSEVGTRLVIEGSQVRTQEPAAVLAGTTISVRNLFYNVPARRQFLKSNTTEMRHIIDEFSRVAMAYPHIAFRLEHNGEEQFRLAGGTFKARIVQLLGHPIEKQLVPIEESLDIIKIEGFIGKPDAALRSKHNQFFFMNHRFIRSAYLHHAVVNGYQNLLDKDMQPVYVINIEVDPARVDVNVHPTKQEVKFEDDQLIYSMMQATVKHGLARYNIAPSLDFTLNKSVTQLPSLGQQSSSESLEKNYLAYAFSQGQQAHIIDQKDALKHWKSLYQINHELEPEPQGLTPSPTMVDTMAEPPTSTGILPIPIPSTPQHIILQGRYLITTLKSGLVLIHIQRALERIHYERLTGRQGAGSPGQKLLFPVHYEVSVQDGLLLQDALLDLRSLGFDIETFGQNSFVIHAWPVDMQMVDDAALLNDIIEQLKHLPKDKPELKKEFVLQRMAKRMATQGISLRLPEEQQLLIDELLSGASPEFAPDGKRIVQMITNEEIAAMLGS